MFEETIEETLRLYPMQILAHCLMPNHWHLYQGRFKSFPVKTDDHFYALVRYVERNALPANLVETTDAWRWGSLWRRVHGVRAPMLTDWPLAEPRNWLDLLNQPQSEAEVNAIRRCILRGYPYGNDDWVQRKAALLGLESTLRPLGRSKVVEK